MKLFLLTLLLLHIAGRDGITYIAARRLHPFRYTIKESYGQTHSLLLRRLVEEEEEDVNSNSSNKEEVPDEGGEAELMGEDEGNHTKATDQEGEAFELEVAEASGELQAHINVSLTEEKLHNKKNVNAESLGNRVGGNETGIGVGQMDGDLDDVNLLRANESAIVKKEDIEEVDSDFKASETLDQAMKLTLKAENQSSCDGKGEVQEESMQLEGQAEARGGFSRSQDCKEINLSQKAEERGKEGDEWTVDDLMGMKEQNETALTRPGSKPKSGTAKKVKPKYTKKMPIKKDKAKGQHKPDRHATKDNAKTVKGFNPDESVSNLDALENTGGMNFSHSAAEHVDKVEEGWTPELKNKLDGNVTRDAEHGKSKHNETDPVATKPKHKDMMKEKGAKKHRTGQTSRTKSQDLDEDKKASNGTMPNKLGKEKDWNKDALDVEEDTAWVSKVKHKTHNIVKHKQTLDEEEEHAHSRTVPSVWINEQEGNEKEAPDDELENVVSTRSAVSKHNQSWEEEKGVDNRPMADALMKKEGNDQQLSSEVVEIKQNVTHANHSSGVEALEVSEGQDTSNKREDGGSETTYAREKRTNGPHKKGNQTAEQIPDTMDSTSMQGNTGYDDDEYSDFMQDFTDLPSKFQETAHKVADHLAPNIQKLTNTSKDYFNITQSFSPLVGKKMAPFFAYLISYSLLLVPLVAVACLFEHIRQLISLQKILLFVNIYLTAYFATLLFATSIIGEPMTFFYRSSMSGYIHLQLLQALGYIFYLILQSFDLVSACSSETLPIRVTAVLQWFVAFMIGMHYYVTVFHRAMAMKGPHTSWKIYGMYSIGFLVLCLCARINRTKKGYHQLGVVDVDKKN